VHVRVVDGLAADHETAVNLWRSANVARLLPPGVDRVARIREKLADPRACLVIGRIGANGGALAMALAEPGRAEHCAGAVSAGYGHVSMGFVHLEPYETVDPGVEHARSAPVPTPGIPSLRPQDQAWRWRPHSPAGASSTVNAVFA
jgi:hypothetical protein